MSYLYMPHDQDFDALILAAAKDHRIAPGLIKGIIAEESSFDPHMTTWEPSHKSTRQPGDTDASLGLMQTTMSVAKDFGWPVGQSFDRLYDPTTSLFWGCKELRAYLDNPARNEGPLTRAEHRAAAGQPLVADAVSAYNEGYPRSIRFTVPEIADIYSYPMSYRTNPPAGWVYANQPYVDHVLAFAALYQAAFDGNTAAVADGLMLLKKKDCTILRCVLNVLPFPWEDSLSPSASSGSSPVVGGTES